MLDLFGSPVSPSRARVIHGDCLVEMAKLEAESVDAVVTDPPYFLTSGNISMDFGALGPNGPKRPNIGPTNTAGRGHKTGGFMNARWDSPETAAIDPGFVHWFAGFVDGEGCFSVHKKFVNGCQTFDCQFSLSLRLDDKPIILDIQKMLGGIGSVAERPAQENAKAQVRYCISSKANCLRLREILSVFPLRAKKARDFEIWSQALDAWVAHEPRGGWDDVAYFREQLMAVRNFGSVHRPERLFFYRVGRQLLRVLKPGGHALIFGGSRTSHHMMCGIEDAGFEIRDTIAWVYGSGFNKNGYVSYKIESRLCEHRKEGNFYLSDGEPMRREPPFRDPDADKVWGQAGALKPAFEPIVVARKPLSEPTVASNVLRHGTGAINVDACRIGTSADQDNARRDKGGGGVWNGTGDSGEGRNITGRWPANLVHDNSDEVLACFPETKTGGVTPGTIDHGKSAGTLGAFTGRVMPTREPNSGSAARFFKACEFSDDERRLFYCAKASRAERNGSKHPTCKPLTLMRYLCRLVCRHGGVVLDPFSGSGTTLAAALAEGFRCIGIEREAEYVEDIHRRIGEYL